MWTKSTVKENIMKIVFHRYGSIVEPDIIAAFKKFNIDVVEEDMEITNKSIDSDTRIKVLGEAILENRPEFVFSINYFPYISSICETLSVKYVALSVDCPVLEIYSETIHNSCNRIFLFDYNQYESIKDENPEGIFYMPLGTNVDRWDETLGKPQYGNIDYKYDVSFVGSLYAEKSMIRSMQFDEADRGYIDAMLKAQSLMSDLAILKEVFRDETPKKRIVDAIKKADGSLFKKYSLSDPIIDTEAYVAIENVLGFELSARDRIDLFEALGSQNVDIDIFTRSDRDLISSPSIKLHDGVTTHTQMPEIFRYSKININHTMRCIETGIPQRVWDIMGCGGLVLTNYTAEIPEYFEIGEDLLCYETKADCLELIQYFKSHDDEREAIARSGYEKVKNLHTYEIRVAAILKEVLGE